MHLRLPLLVLSLALLATLAAPGSLRGEAFSADMVVTARGATRTVPFHFADGSYRFEQEEKGRALVVQFDAAAQVIRVLAPAEKAYREFKANDLDAVMLSPFASCLFPFEGANLRSEGSETIDGLPCTKRVLAVRKHDFFISWTADAFGLPVRVEDRVTDRTVELRNLKRGPQDATLFTVPAGFQLVQEPKEQPPSWAADLAKTPRLTPPFEKPLQAGAVVRVPSKAGFIIKITVTNPSTGDSTAVGAPFKDGLPLYDPSGSTFTIQPEGEVQTTQTTPPEKADDYVFHVIAGQVVLRAEYAPATDGKAKTAAPAATGEARLFSPASVGVAVQLEVGWEGPAADGDFITVVRPEQSPTAFITRAAVREGNPVKLWAPSDPGAYEIRYTSGRPTKVLTSAPLHVEAATASVGIAGSSIAVAAPFEVEWEGPQTPGDFISIAKLGTPPGGSEYHVPVRNGNPAKLRAPSVPGEYEIRYVLGRGARRLANIQVSVTPVEASVEPPENATTASDFTVGWTGPGYEEDYLCVAAVSTPPHGPTLSAVRVSQGNPGKLRAPKQPGNYEVRYILGRGKQLLAKAPITVVAP